MVYEEGDNDEETITRQIAQVDFKTIMRIIMITLMRMTTMIGMMHNCDW